LEHGRAAAREYAIGDGAARSGVSGEGAVGAGHAGGEAAGAAVAVEREWGKRKKIRTSGSHKKFTK
jgi:hypothetical protein